MLPPLMIAFVLNGCDLGTGGGAAFDAADTADAATEERTTCLRVAADFVDTVERTDAADVVHLETVLSPAAVVGIM